MLVGIGLNLLLCCKLEVIIVEMFLGNLVVFFYLKGIIVIGCVELILLVIISFNVVFVILEKLVLMSIKIKINCLNISFFFFI